MELIDYVLLAVVVIILGLAGRYICKAKKNGKKCIGCPYCDSCSAKECASMCDCAEAEQN